MPSIVYNNRAKQWRVSLNDVYLGAFESRHKAEVAQRAYMVEQEIKRLSVTKSAFSITKSSSVFTMALYPKGINGN